MPLLAYLNSAVVTEYLSLVTPRFQGGFQKYEPRHLSSIPIPNTLLHDLDTRALLATNADRVLAAVRAHDEQAQRTAEAAIEALILEAIELGNQETQ
jgi:hypothetical protein